MGTGPLVVELGQDFTRLLSKNTRWQEDLPEKTEAQIMILLPDDPQSGSLVRVHARILEYDLTISFHKFIGRSPTRGVSTESL